MIDRSNWRWFRVGDLFPPQKCKCSNATEFLEDGDEIAYIGAKKSDNGVMRYVKRDEKLVSRGNCLVFIGDGQGSVGYTIYQPADFIGSTTLIAGYNLHLNPYNAAFLVSILDQERFRYSFGRKFKKEIVANTKIQLPAVKLDSGEYEPDWQYMETFVKDQIIPQLPKKAQKVWLQKYDTKPLQEMKPKLNKDEWKWFVYEKLFDIKKGKRLTQADMIEGQIRYIGAIDSNNGLSAYIGNNSQLHNGNTITVSYNGSIGYAFYQDEKFWATDDVNVLYPKFSLNRYIAIFLCTIIQQEQYRFCYGRKWDLEMMKKSRMKLPAIRNEKGEYEPDWQFMEDYIKSLPYSRNLEPSKPDEVVDELVEMKKEMIKMRRVMEAQQPGSINNYGTVNIYER